MKMEQVYNLIEKAKLGFALEKSMSKGYRYSNGFSRDATGKVLEQAERLGYKRVRCVFNMMPEKMQETLLKSSMAAPDIFERIIKEPLKYMELLKTVSNAEVLLTVLTGLQHFHSKEQVDRFLRLDMKELARCKITFDAKGMNQVMRFFPFMTNSFFLHSLKNISWKRWYDSCLYDCAVFSSDRDMVKILCDSICKEPCAQNLMSDHLLLLLGLYKKDKDVVAFLNFMKAKKSLTLNSYYLQSAELEKVESFKTLKEQLSKLNTQDICQAMDLFHKAGYKESFMKKLVWQLGQMDDLERETLFSLPASAIAAWVYGKTEIFEFSADINSHSDDSKTLFDSIVNNQRHFLQLLETGEITGCELEEADKHTSFLRRYVNLNSWNAKQFKQAVERELFSVDKWIISQLENRVYGYQELEVLKMIRNTRSHKSVIESCTSVFLSLLKNIRMEDACIRMKQYLMATDSNPNDEAMECVVEALTQYDLPKWRDTLFSFKASNELAAKSLPCLHLQGVIKEAKNEVEVKFILNSPELCENRLQEGIKQFLAADKQVVGLRGFLDLPDDFYETFRASSDKFFIDGNAEIANAYLNDLGSELSNKYRIVLKAALSDKLNQLRYTDLDKECNMVIQEHVLSVWENDAVLTKDNLTTYEDSTFAGIMSIGHKPTYSCMNYKDGIYKECLLSYFDGNKKAIFVKCGNHILARAIIRLTKSTFKKTERRVLDFTDVTAESYKQATSLQEEKIVLFLERTYSGIQGDERVRIEEAIIRFVEQKAKAAGVGFVFSSDYEQTVKQKKPLIDSFLTKNIGVYITKSKAGCQYLDSFGGKFTNYGGKNGEDQYCDCKCFIPKEVESHHEIVKRRIAS